MKDESVCERCIQYEGKECGSYPRYFTYIQVMESDQRTDSDGTYEPDDRSSSASISTVIPHRKQISDYLVGGGGIEDYTEPEDALKVCNILKICELAKSDD